MLGRISAARATAQKVLNSLEACNPAADELAWIHASKADAFLIFERHADAELMYRHAVALVDPRGKQSMHRQVKLLVESAPEDSTLADFWTSRKLEELFGALP